MALNSLNSSSLKQLALKRLKRLTTELTVRTDKDTVDVVLVGAQVLGGRRRRLVELVERDLYFAVEQPPRSLVVAVDPMESFDVHPQLEQTTPSRVRHVPTKVAHARYAAHRFRHPTDDVMTHGCRPHRIICASTEQRIIYTVSQKKFPPLYSL